MPLSGFVVGEDALRGGNDDVAELPTGQNGGGPPLESRELDVVARRDHTALVDAADELNDDLLGAMVVDDFELSDVAVLLHELEEADDEEGDRSDEDLLLAAALGIDDGVEAVSQDVDLDHGEGVV